LSEEYSYSQILLKGSRPPQVKKKES